MEIPSSETKPKVFISYAWSDDRSEMVREISQRLMADGIEVVLDQWELREGDDTNAFMERSVTDKTITKVLIFSDEMYTEKASRREGGVGTESQIISPHFYQKVSNTKFIPIVCEKDDHQKAYLPAFLISRFYIDFSSQELINDGWEQLVRRIYDRPQFKKPVRGSTPSYILHPPT